jgi:hypothetical protein
MAHPGLQWEGDPLTALSHLTITKAFRNLQRRELFIKVKQVRIGCCFSLFVELGGSLYRDGPL